MANLYQARALDRAVAQWNLLTSSKGEGWYPPMFATEPPALRITVTATSVADAVDGPCWIILAVRTSVRVLLLSGPVLHVSFDFCANLV